MVAMTRSCVLRPEEDADPADPIRLMTLNHAKSRDGETKDVCLRFHRRFQKFEDAGPFVTPRRQGRPLRLSTV